jgi:hypothetical protein
MRKNNFWISISLDAAVYEPTASKPESVWSSAIPLHEPTQDPRCNNPKNQGKFKNLIIKKSTVVAQSIKLTHKV